MRSAIRCCSMRAVIHLTTMIVGLLQEANICDSKRERAGVVKRLVHKDCVADSLQHKHAEPGRSFRRTVPTQLLRDSTAPEHFECATAGTCTIGYDATPHAIKSGTKKHGNSLSGGKTVAGPCKTVKKQIGPVRRYCAEDKPGFHARGHATQLIPRFPSCSPARAETEVGGSSCTPSASDDRCTPPG